MAWNSLSLPCFAEPPAESPSTIYNSVYGDFGLQSDNLPGSASFFNLLPAFTNDLALRAASSASLALRDFIIIDSKIDS
ncbi:hypothetical protein D3C71_1425350 [compost metagenome]